MSTKVRPSRCVRNSAHIARRECGSIPEVGSSRKVVVGWPSRAIAKQSLRFWPPLSEADGTFARSASPTRANISFMILSSWVPYKPFNSP